VEPEQSPGPGSTRAVEAIPDGPAIIPQGVVEQGGSAMAIWRCWMYRNIKIPDKAVITTKIIDNSAVLFLALMVLKVAKATSSQPDVGKSSWPSAHPHRSPTKRYVKWVGFLSRNRGVMENRPVVTFLRLPHRPHLVKDWAWTPGFSWPWTLCPPPRITPWVDLHDRGHNILVDPCGSVANTF